jgi:hypothetical protein
MEEMRYQITLPAPSTGHLATDRESSFLVQASSRWHLITH